MLEQVDRAVLEETAKSVSLLNTTHERVERVVMVTKPYTKPVTQSAPRVNHEIEVGEDLQFQRKWWRFENFAWTLFSLIIVLDLAGLFGRGPIARTELRAADGTIDMKYERIERTDSPSLITIDFGPSAIHEGKIKLYISESLVKGLGTQRVVPAPTETTVGEGGLTYTFPASEPPAAIDLALQPSGPGIYHFMIGVANAKPIQAKVFVVP
jgi:hypothetical protein